MLLVIAKKAKKGCFKVCVPQISYYKSLCKLLEVILLDVSSRVHFFVASLTQILCLMYFWILGS